MLLWILVALALLVVAGLLLTRCRDHAPLPRVESPTRHQPRETASAVSAQEISNQQVPDGDVRAARSPSAAQCSRPELRSGTERAKLGGTPFAVIDVETTGFHPVPDGSHRIVEVAVVRMSPDGRIEDEYVTLVNPQRKMGATHVHGIRTADVARAPSFAEIAGDVGSRIADAIVVAHNVNFDLRFLRGEYAHAGMELPDVPHLCTLDLAYRFADVSCRKLGFLCEEYGIPIDAHSALGDARAVSQLLVRFLDEARTRGGESATAIGFPEVPLAGIGWCPTPPSGLSVQRRARADGARDALEALVAKCSARRPVAKREQQYLDALELALADSDLTPEESGALAALARELDVSMRDVHRRYVESLADGAKADGVVTAAEAAEVQRIAALLEVPDADVAPMLVVPSRPAPTRPVERGAAVCFVGAFDLPVMAQLVDVATERSFVMRKNITASVSVVVVESARSDVRRQDRAKALGIPVLTADQFLSLHAAMAGA
jgi:DNA polymerase-3 subunit epsilon